VADLSVDEFLKTQPAPSGPPATPAPVGPAAPGDYQAQARQAALRNGLDPDLFVRLIANESSFNANAVSPKGAVGLGQLTPATASSLGVNPRVPAENLDGSARYLKQQLDRFGNYPQAVAAYNAGPGNVQKYGGIPPFPETQNEVAKVAGAAPAVPNAPDSTLPRGPSSPESALSVDQFLATQSQNAPEAPGATPTQQPTDFTGMVGNIARGLVEGAVSPITAAGETGAAILSDPRIGLLPASEQQDHEQKALAAAVQGAAFYGSLFVAGPDGPLASLPLQGILKSAIMGAAAGASYEGISDLPQLVDRKKDFGGYLKDISSASTFGALTGGVLHSVPKALQITTAAAKMSADTVLGAANKVVDAIPGGSDVRTQVAQFGRKMWSSMWDKFFTSGSEVLNKAGLGDLVTKLEDARGAGATLAGKYVAGFYKNIQGLSVDERRLMGYMLDKIDFQNVSQDTIDAYSGGGGRNAEIFQRAWAEADRLRAMGEAIQKTGLELFDPGSQEFHQFILRRSYLPHRFVNPDGFLDDGPIRSLSIKRVMKALNYTQDDAVKWIDDFAGRVAGENDEWLRDPTALRSGANHYMVGRSIGLPGYETDVQDLLPQYYDSAARKITNHAYFGPKNAVESAVQQALFQKGKLGEGLGAQPPQADQGELFSGQETFGGQGMPTTPRGELPQPQTIDDIIKARAAENQKQASADFGIERRYPEAFAQLERVQDPTLKSLSTTILRRQLGALEKQPIGEQALNFAARIEVVTKLALGAIAQPSQMLSGIVRTGFRGSLKNMMASLADDPEALDFALRSGVTLRSVVRESEQSLTGGETDFLKRVYFTQFDSKSRVFGALQGASYAEQQARKMVQVMDNGTLGARQAQKIAGNLQKLGLDAAGIAQRGGWLNEDELLKAAQSVSGDVNFWGDALSLPEFYKSPYGRYITQFKSFGFQQTKLIKDMMIKPAMDWVNSGGERGSLGPLTRFALLMPAGGEVITDLKKWIRARKRTDAPVARVMENIANAAGFGLAYDAFDATQYGMSGSLGLLVGPNISEAGKAMTAVGAAARGQPARLAHYALETGLPAITSLTVPAAAPAVAAVAPALANIVAPAPQ